MLEFILSKTVLIAFSLAVLVASGSMVSSFFSEENVGKAASSFHQVVDIVRQTEAFGSECRIRLDMSRFLGTESSLRIGNGSIVLWHDGQVLSADLAEGSILLVFDDEGREAAVIDVARNDVLVLERRWNNDILLTVAYIEKVDATFSTAFTNRSTSSTVL